MRNQKDDDKLDQLKSTIKIAEGRRLDKKYREAMLIFEDMVDQNGPLNSDFQRLGPEQRRWVKAHYAAATRAYFIPHDDREGHLNGAEDLLCDALRVAPDDWDDILGDDRFKPKFGTAWAWAQLGEVFRIKGNLPPFDFSFYKGKPRLLARTSDVYYRKSGKCFEIALSLRPDYPWAQAHYAAAIINSRRFDDLIGTPKCAKERLTSALERHRNRYAWGLFHRGAAEFLEIIGDLTQKTAKPVAPRRGSRPKKDKEDLPPEIKALLMAYDMVVALIDDTSSLYRNPMHPGSIGRDEYLTLTYDLMAKLARGFFERGRASKRGNGGLPLRVLLETLTAGRHFLREDDWLPGSERIRFAYAVKYLKFYSPDKRSGSLIDKFVDKLTVDDPDDNDLYKNEPAFLDEFGKILKSTALPSGAKSTNVGNSMRRQHDVDHTGVAVLLRLFDMMMVLLKRAVMYKIGVKDPMPWDTIVGLLEQFNEALPVFRKDKSRRAIPIGTIVEDLRARVVSGQCDWLLQPLWAPRADEWKVIAQFLDFDYAREL